MPRPIKRGILGGSTIILSKDIDKYVFMCGSNLYESYVMNSYWKRSGQNVFLCSDSIAQSSLVKPSNGDFMRASPTYFISTRIAVGDKSKGFTDKLHQIRFC